MSYLALDKNILTSSLWVEGDSSTKIFWIWLLLVADSNGEVFHTIPAMARDTGISRSDVERILTMLSEPDPDSRTKEFEGRRIEVFEGGIRLLNYRKYKTKDHSTDRVRRHRERNVTICNDMKRYETDETACNGLKRSETIKHKLKLNPKEKEKEKEINKEKEKEKKPLSVSDDIRRVFDFWVETFWSGRGPEPRLDQKRREKIKARLKDGHTVEQLLGAIAGASKSDFHVTKKYTDLSTILRDSGTVEAHFGRAMDGSDAVRRPTPEVVEARRLLTKSTDTVIAIMKENGDYEKHRRIIEDWEAKNGRK